MSGMHRVRGQKTLRGPPPVCTAHVVIRALQGIKANMGFAENLVILTHIPTHSLLVIPTQKF